MRKPIIIKSIFCTVLFLFSQGSINAEVSTSGDWEYDGTKIVKYRGNAISVIVPSSIDAQGITSIGEFTFRDSPNVSNITFSEGITTLDDYSLMGINRLRSLTLPKSLTTVGSATLNTMVIDNIYIYSIDSWLGIDYTGRSVLANGTNLNIIKGIQPQISVPVTEYTFKVGQTLKTGAFAGIKSLTKVDLRGCRDIPANAFGKCINLYEVIYSDNLTSIGEGAFTGSAIRSVILPESVHTIGNNAYSDCRNVEQIRLGRNLSEIGNDAFSDIAENVPITAAGSTPAIGGYSAFSPRIRSTNDLFVPEESLEAYNNEWGFTHIEGCPATDSDWIMSNGYITAYTGTSTNVSIPQYVGVDYVQGFTPEVFQGNTSIRTVVFPEFLEDMPENAFKGCTLLSRVIFSNNLRSIPTSAFEGCSSLISITLPESVSTIGEYAFANSGLLDFAVPEGLKSIEKYAFEGCTIGRVDCQSLSQWMKIDFGNPYANPGYNHTRLFINGVELKTLDSYDVTINSYSFYGNESLEKVILNEAAVVGKGAFSGCRNLVLIAFVSNLIMVDRNAFDGCGTGETLAFGNNIWSIGELAFRRGESDDTLKSLYFGSDLTYIEPWAFEGHDEITDIYLSSTRPPYLCSLRGSEEGYDAEVFSEKVKENALLHVPDGYEAEYKEKWGFKNVVGNASGMLTVKIPEGGNLSFINPTKGMRLRITPEDDNWEISSASLGDSNITDAIDASGYYTLPVIEGDVVLNVIFKKKDDSGLANVNGEKSPITMSVFGDTLNISGATSGSEVRVYNTNGQLITATRNHSFQLNAKGVLILTVDGQTFKFVK